MVDEIQTAATEPTPAAVEPLTDRVNDIIDIVLAISAFHDERYNRLARPQPADHARLTELVARLKALKSA